MAITVAPAIFCFCRYEVTAFCRLASAATFWPSETPPQTTGPSNCACCWPAVSRAVSRLIEAELTIVTPAAPELRLFAALWQEDGASAAASARKAKQIGRASCRERV